MGIFNRHPRQEPTATTGHSNGHGTATKAPFWGRKQQHGHGNGYNKGHNGHVGETYSISKRPSFGQWLKATWIDILTMVAMGLLGLGIYEAKPAANRSFPVTFADGEIVYPEFAYPLRKEIIPIYAAALMASLIPILIILLMQIRVRSFWDVNNAIIGLLYALITAAVFQVWLKWLIGGLRPHFLAVCKPDISLASNGPGVVGAPLNGAGFGTLFYTREICTGDVNEINDSLESFPSGHTTAAFAGFVFLSLYLNAKLKVFSNYHPAMWKLIVIWAPILAATLIGGALTIDEYHNWYDVVAGAIIGTVMAFSAYRMTYASIWDWRYNHIPLHRGQAASFAEGMEGSHFVGTRKVGWGAGAMAAASAVAGKHHHDNGGHHHGMTGQEMTSGHHHTNTNGYDNGYANEGYVNHGGHHEGFSGDHSHHHNHRDSAEHGAGFMRKPVAAHGTHGDQMV